jgi:hypothetical protein
LADTGRNTPSFEKIRALSVVKSVKTLFVLAGYRGDVERALAASRREFGPDNYDFIARTYPENSFKRQNYVGEIGQHVVDFIFGTTGATTFCRAQHFPCAAEKNKSVAKSQRCRAAPGAACHRARPGMLVFIVNNLVVEEIFQRFGRGAIVTRFEKDSLSDIESLMSFVKSQAHTIEKIRHFLANLRSNVLAPRIPMNNFQIPANQPIARDAQANLGNFADTMNRYHDALYNPDFQNPRKGTRGAYMYSESIGFQRDRLHISAQIGVESRKNIFHLINAYHLYGLATEPGFHFDVMSTGGKELRKIFRDILSGTLSSPNATHVNISPCDRLL